MATESNVRSAHGVRTYRGRTLEEILPQIREELGPDAVILREREGLVGGVGGFFAQRFIEVEARRGDGQSIDIYDDSPDDELDLSPALDDEVTERPPPALPAGEPEGPDEPPTLGQPMEFTARRQTPLEEPADRSQPKPFAPPVVQRERILPPREPEPPAPTRRFETDVFLERLRAASAVLPDDDDLTEPSSTALGTPVIPPAGAPEPPTEPRELELPEEPAPRPQRRATPERKPRSPQPRRARPAPRPQTSPKPTRRPPAEQEYAEAEEGASTAAEPELAAPQTQTNPPRLPSHTPAAPQPAPHQTARRRPPSLQVGLPTGGPASPPPAPAPGAPVLVPAPIPGAPRPLEFRGDHAGGGVRGVLARLLGGRFGRSSLIRPSTPNPIDPVAAAEITTDLTTRGASQTWTAELINTAGAHGSPLAGSLRAAAEAEIARRIVPPPALPITGTAVAFIGAGGSGKTRCTAALASAYSRASTLGVTVIALDNPDGASELKRLLSGDGVPVLSLSGERAQRAIAAARQGGFVIVDTPTATPTHPDEIEALSLKLAPLELDATFVTLPATLGAQAARRALASFGRLRPSAVAITHADETDQLGVVVEIAVAHRIPLAYLHAGTDHHSALTAVDAAGLAQQLLAT